MQLLVEKSVLQLYFLIPDISLTLTEDEGKEEQKIVTASVKGISVIFWSSIHLVSIYVLICALQVAFNKRTFDMTSEIVIYELNLEDFQQTWGDSFKYLISSQVELNIDACFTLTQTLVR